MKSKGKILLISGIVLIIGIAVYLIFFYKPSSAGEEFNVGSVLLKTVIKQGGKYEGVLSIENLKNYKRHFEIYFKNLDGLVKVNNNSFDLEAGQKYPLQVTFSNPNNLSEGVYVGSLSVLSGESSRITPIILGVETGDVLFNSNIKLYPGDVVSPGSTLNAEVNILDMGQIGSSEVSVEYFVKDFEGNTFFSEKENVVVKEKVTVTKPIMLPEKIKNGDYVFGVVIKYKNSVGTASAFFRISNAKTTSLFEGTTLYFIAFAGFMLLLFLLFMFYSIYSRDRLLDELKSQYKSELIRQERSVKEREKQVECRLKTREERKISKKIFKKVRKARIKEIKKIHKERVKRLKQLKKHNKRNEMKIQINKWKKQGYNTNVFDAKIPSVDSIRSQINKWKKQGYNTAVLEK